MTAGPLAALRYGKRTRSASNLQSHWQTKHPWQSSG